MRTQLVAARTVAEALADLATDPEAVPGPVLEIAGPREESMVEAAKRLMAARGDAVRIEGVTWDPLYEEGAALPGPGATSPADVRRVAHGFGAGLELNAGGSPAPPALRLRRDRRHAALGRLTMNLHVYD